MKVEVRRTDGDGRGREGWRVPWPKGWPIPAAGDSLVVTHPLGGNGIVATVRFVQWFPEQGRIVIWLK